MWEASKNWKRIFPSELFEKVVIVYHSVDFISETIDMFGFISKFKKDVTSGFDAVHQRLVTLETRVGALFEHAKTTAVTDTSTVVTKVEAAPAAVAAIPAETVAAVEAVPAEVVAEVKASV
jgi:uncharacterized membrane protein